MELGCSAGGGGPGNVGVELESNCWLSSQNKLSMSSASSTSVVCSGVLQIPHVLHHGSPRQSGFPQNWLGWLVMSRPCSSNSLSILVAGKFLLSSCLETVSGCYVLNQLGTLTNGIYCI